MGEPDGSQSEVVEGVENIETLNQRVGPLQREENPGATTLLALVQAVLSEDHTAATMNLTTSGRQDLKGGHRGSWSPFLVGRVDGHNLEALLSLGEHGIAEMTGAVLLKKGRAFEKEIPKSVGVAVAKE